jgi:dTDP-4-dehydrorhamnose 3,5-epimerase
MKIQYKNFQGIEIINGNLFSDKRGYLREIYKKKQLNKNLIFHYLAKSKKNVFRGFHFNKKFQQEKLITVLEGSILDMCLDLRKNSQTYGKIFSVLLSEKNRKSIYIPKGFAHGYLSLEDDNLVYFQNSNYRQKKFERIIFWNDVDLDVKWPYKKPLVSIKDQKGMTFKEFIKNYKNI